MNEIANIKKVNIFCNKCTSELTFNIDAHNEYNSVYNCPLCGSAYGLDPENNIIVKAKELITGAKQAKGARISFICEVKE